MVKKQTKSESNNGIISILFLWIDGNKRKVTRGENYWRKIRLDSVGAQKLKPCHP